MTYTSKDDATLYAEEKEGRSNLLRFGLGFPVAGALTVGLACLMAALIVTEFTPEEKFATQKFEINPVSDDLKSPLERTKPEPLKDIDIPPARPTLPTEKAQKVSPGPISDPKAGNILQPVVLDLTRTALVINNRNPDPLLRLPPAMPSRADRSGHCDVRLNVDSSGSPYQVEATYCTQRVFERPTIKAVAKWKYRPRIVDGRAVAMEGLTNRVSFHLIDGQGDIIPE